MTERRRPTHTVIVPNDEYMAVLVGALISKRQTFTVEPGSDGTFHLGLLSDGVSTVTELYGPAKDIGTFGEYQARQQGRKA